MIPRDDLDDGLPLGDLELLDNERKLRLEELSGDRSGDDLSILKLSVVPNIDCTLKLLVVSCVGSGLHLSSLFGVDGDCELLLGVDLSLTAPPTSMLLFDNWCGGHCCCCCC